MKRTVGKWAWAGAGGALAVAAGFAVSPRSGAEVPHAAKPPPPPPARAEVARESAAAALQLALARLERGGSATAAPSADLFAVRSWQPPPPPPPPPPPVVAAAPLPPPPPPQAPPLPFTLIGRLEEGPERVVYFLRKGEHLHTVAVGDVIENTYRLEQAGGGRLTLLYLPLNQRQVLTEGRS
ncbi:secretion system X translation initiation factor [Caldimonas tepidiphila]|uniref:secretion system X translation initiation factor n=1 Tax=Caldimonas tepidiphila TaxID=2315841 RepID=UPI001300A84A|nr:secretion system X translation initiation factor [Caldimonas tepidiphila]